MGLQLTGELLAVTIKDMRTKDGESYEARTLTVFDADTGEAIKVTAGRDVSSAELFELQRHVADRPFVTLGVSLFNNRHYVERIVDVELTKAASNA